MAIYTIVIAAVWQTSGFVMAMFLAGLRGIDNEILKAAQIDGASNLAALPPDRHSAAAPGVPVGLRRSSRHLAIKSYDLVIALTGGGPGRATELPATFMYSYTFTRNQMGIGASSAVIMLMTIAAIMVPYLYAELKEKTVMSGRPPRTPPSRTGRITRAFIYLVLLALRAVLPAAALRDGGELAEAAGRDHRRQHDGPAAAAGRSSPGGRPGPRRRSASSRRA